VDPENLITKKPLNQRQLLKRKCKKIRGRVNALKSELSQLEPVLAKLEERLQQTNPNQSEVK
jgi:hypothetical protein